MKRPRLALFLFLLTLISFSASAQKKMIIGYLADSFSKEPVLAHITLMRLDSTVVDTITAKKEAVSSTKYNAVFYIVIKEQGKFILKLEKEGYITTYTHLNLKFIKRAAFFNAGFINMKRDPYYLHEFTVTATKIKMVIRGDTVVYNADAFQLAHGSMLDALVKQLPGVELKSDGRIYKNGKFVESLMVNGKDFFNGDPKVALDNLPAYMVKDIKIYDRQDNLAAVADKTKQHLVLDVNLKKQYSIGWIANADLALGTKKRYSEKLFALRFTKNSRLAIFGTANNLNDEKKPGETVGNWNPQNVSHGLLATKKAGLSYQLEVMNHKGSVSSFHTDNIVEHRNADNRQRTSSETFLSGGNAFGRAYSASNDKNTNLSSNNRFVFHSSSYATYLYSSFKVNYNKFNTHGHQWSGNFSGDPSTYINNSLLDSLFTNNSGSLFKKLIVNRMRQESIGNGHELALTFYNGANFKANKQTNDRLNLNFDVNYNNSKNELYDHYLLEYPTSDKNTADFRNRYYHKPGRNYKYSASIGYDYDICRDYMNGGATIYVTPSYGFTQEYRSAENALYRLDGFNGWGKGTGHALGYLPSTVDSLQLAIDNDNSYHSTLHSFDHDFCLQGTLSFNLTHEPKNYDKTFSFQAQLHLKNHTNRLNYYRNLKAYPTRRTMTAFEPLLFFNYHHKNSDMSLTYLVDENMPEMTYLLDIRDDSNPLFISLGNSSLKNSRTHTLSFQSQSTFKHGDSFSTNIDYSVEENMVSMGFVYDKASGVRTTKPENVNGNWYLNSNATYSRPLDKKNQLTLTSNTSANYRNDVDLVGVTGSLISSRSTVHNLNFVEELKLNYRPSSKFQVGAKLAADWTHATSKREDFETINVGNINYGVTGQFDFPGQVQISTDLTMYSRRGYQDSYMNTNELVWNARLAKTLLHGNLTFAIDGFDILGKLSNVQRTLNAQGRTESYFNVIPRYAMAHVIYRLNIQPKKKN